MSTFSGEDHFDTTPIQVLLSDGTHVTDVSKFLDRPTHYHMTLNLGGNGVKLASNSQRFILRWNNQVISTVTIIQPATPVCKTDVVEFKPSPVDFLPPKTRGDREFNGNGPDVTVSVELVHTDEAMSALVTMTAKETKKDWTTASGSKIFPLYTVDPGWRIQQIVGAVNSDLRYRDNDHEEDTYSGSGPVATYIFRGDGEGKDAGVHTKVNISFNQVRVELIQDRDCVSPIAVRILELQELISPQVLEHLRPLSEEVQISTDLRRRLEPQFKDFVIDSDLFQSP